MSTASSTAAPPPWRPSPAGTLPLLCAPRGPTTTSLPPAARTAANPRTVGQIPPPVRSRAETAAGIPPPARASPRHGSLLVWVTGAVLTLVFLWWVTDAVPLEVASMAPLFLFPPRAPPHELGHRHGSPSRAPPHAMEGLLELHRIWHGGAPLSSAGSRGPAAGSRGPGEARRRWVGRGTAAPTASSCSGRLARPAPAAGTSHAPHGGGGGRLPTRLLPTAGARSGQLPRPAPADPQRWRPARPTAAAAGCPRAAEIREMRGG
ncbi:translation initiation factor IF-2-like [Panicum virgatum]|uniref:translation initiation factor IF-2-like n=1 Tax=Panicum virgatum TaxID=38727 RepID=UPI0019D583A6|nr:translation initiation factor IF-2-like [Panicum virgatum]